MARICPGTVKCECRRAQCPMLSPKVSMEIIGVVNGPTTLLLGFSYYKWIVIIVVIIIIIIIVIIINCSGAVAEVLKGVDLPMVGCNTIFFV